jgi:hypothetical protein
MCLACIGSGTGGAIPAGCHHLPHPLIRCHQLIILLPTDLPKPQLLVEQYRPLVKFLLRDEGLRAHSTIAGVANTVIGGNDNTPLVI